MSRYNENRQYLILYFCQHIQKQIPLKKGRIISKHTYEKERIILSVIYYNLQMEMQRKESQGSHKQKVKIVFLGDKGVGKSSVIQKFTLNKFDQNLQATIGVDFLTKMCRFNGYKYKLELWDTAGQQKYRSLIKGYLRGANACVFVYDQSNPNTYLNMLDWIRTFEEVSNDNAKTTVLIFGNKTDLLTNSAEIEKAKREGIILFPKLREMMQLEGSAKTGHNIHQVFQTILQEFEKNCQEFKNVSSTRTIGQNLVKNFNLGSGYPKNWHCCNV